MLLYLAEDTAAAVRIQSKNSLELYAYNLHNSITDEDLTNKFEAGGKTKLEGTVNKTAQGRGNRLNHLITHTHICISSRHLD